MNIFDILVLALICLALIGAICLLVHKKHCGCSGCSGCCSGCSAGHCGKRK